MSDPTLDKLLDLATKAGLDAIKMKGPLDDLLILGLRAGLEALLKTKHVIIHAGPEATVAFEVLKQKEP